jgi:hypothetical protein
VVRVGGGAVKTGTVDMVACGLTSCRK